MTSLIEEAEEFLETSLEDPELFGWPMTLTNPLGQSQEVYGQARHINMFIDMDTGSDVQQEQSSVTVRLSTLTIGEPLKNWLVTTTDTSNNSYDFFVAEAIPDRTFGIVVLKLKLVEEAP